MTALLRFETVFRGAPPARDGDYLLGQRVLFTREHWLRHLPDPAFWPDELDRCPTIGTTQAVDRRTMFAIAERADDELGAMHALVASYVWAAGLRARVATRLGLIFDANREAFGSRLSAAVRTARRDGPVVAFASLSRKGLHAIPRLGGPFFTKVLYFSSFGRAAGGRQPLLLDQHVVVAFNNLRNTNWNPAGPWSPEQYEDYLHYASVWAEQWQPGTSPDLVERTLGAAGKALGTDRAVWDVASSRRGD